MNKDVKITSCLPYPITIFSGYLIMPHDVEKYVNSSDCYASVYHVPINQKVGVYLRFPWIYLPLLYGVFEFKTRRHNNLPLPSHDLKLFMQVPHISGLVDFPERKCQMSHEWAISQVEISIDYSRN